jgi:hypothetical protein
MGGKGGTNLDLHRMRRVNKGFICIFCSINIITFVILSILILPHLIYSSLQFGAEWLGLIRRNKSFFFKFPILIAEGLLPAAH